ncbi:hypothetical protein V6C03_10235 [Methyloligella sp. 2.7D]|uniref:amino acid kinase family protein n=1 Tax=unclassified Methyloligella TaxID=2625955 RepID=UPI00157D5549|nr:hypothetical protein [Methyloligella sp. GL2]QKP77784.1 hypothetical protein HT051_10220 [Methyloligella sp. GL2]
MAETGLKRQDAIAPDGGEMIRPVVVKLGGSVVRSPYLQDWLNAVATAARPIVVVPGGGALADEVRDCQTSLGFDDLAAHRMALLAMDQLAWAVAGLRPDFEVGDSEQALLQSLGQNRIAVWAPFAHIGKRSDIAPSWAITSDSLALWLAGQLGAECCYMIKQVPRTGSAVSAAMLAADGVVDEAFPEMLGGTAVPAYLLGPEDRAVFGAALARSATCGTRIAA